MYELLEAGNITKVPMFIGINSEEYISLAAGMLIFRSNSVVNFLVNFLDLSNVERIALEYDSNPLSLVPWQFDTISEDKRQYVAEQIKEAYVGLSTFTNNLGSVVSVSFSNLEYSWITMFLQYYSDSAFTKSIIRFAELYAKHSPVYFYQFSYKGPMGIYQYSIEGTVKIIIKSVERQKWFNITGADNVAHGEESHYLSIVKAGSFDNTNYSQFSESDVLTHWRLIELWSNFYKYG